MKSSLSRTTLMRALLATMFLWTLGCGSGGGGGLFGGDGEGGILGGDGLFGNDADPYDEPQITLISSSMIAPDGTVVVKALVDEEETPLVNWVVRFNMQCSTGSCTTENHIERGEFGESREISFRHTFGPDVTLGNVDIEASYLVKPNDERQARIVHSYNVAREPLKNQPGVVVIASPEDFDELPLDADGRLEGDLLIQGVVGLEDLSGLSSLRHVEGSLIIQSNPDLTSLVGMQNLISVGGRLEISHNWNLSALGSFDRLELIGDALEIRGVQPAREMPNLPVLEQCGSVRLVETSAMETLFGLPALERSRGIDLIDNVALERIDLQSNNLPSLDYFLVENNDALTRLDLPSSLTSIDEVRVERNRALESLQGFSNVSDVELLTIDYNHSVPDLSGFEQITEVELLHIEHNHELTTLDGLKNLSQVEDQVVIKRNHKLPECEADAFAARLGAAEREVERNNNEATCN